MVNKVIMRIEKGMELDRMAIWIERLNNLNGNQNIVKGSSMSKGGNVQWRSV